MQPDYNSDSEKGDYLEGQPQYQKYIDCHKYRIHPCTFGVKSTGKCGDPQGGSGGGSGCGGGDQSHGGCWGPGDPGHPGHGGCFTYAELDVDQAPCLDLEDLTPFIYCYDVMNGNKYFDLGELPEAAPCD